MKLRKLKSPRHFSIIALGLGLATTLAAQPAPSPGVPDFYMKWTVDAVGGGEWPNDSEGVFTGVASRFLDIHQAGETYVDTDLSYQADPFFLSGIWDSFETWTYTYVCGSHPTSAFTRHVVYTTLDSGSQPRNAVFINVAMAPDGSPYVPDPFAISGFALLGYPSTYLDITTASGADCNGPISSMQTISLPADGVPPTFVPGDIPATNAAGTHFSRDSYLTYYVDPYSLVPVVFHFHVEITDLHQCNVEICDGLDNDCDGEVDDGVLNGYHLDADGDGYGHPNVNAFACVAPAGYVAGGDDCDDSNPNIYPFATEICNGADDDCDGFTDEGSLGGGAQCGDTDIGECSYGTIQCHEGSPQCISAVSPVAETCDGLDNDCDGALDNGNPGGGQGCNTGLQGVCAAGTTTCSNGSVTCSQDVQPSAEICDGLDNDCDGAVDNGNPGGGVACDTGQLGVCTAGTTICSNGAIACNHDSAPSAEVCDGLDNDCDGSVDDGNPDSGVACATLQPGLCAMGTTVCSGGSLGCVPNVGPSPESCDALDNDCDGAVDEGGVCGGAAALLTSLSPARVWVGLQNGADSGIRFDLAAKIYLNDVEVGSGQLDSALGGSTGFEGAKFDTIKLSLSAPVLVVPGSFFRIEVLVRNACKGSGKSSGRAALWYNGPPTDHGPKKDAGSRFDAKIGGAKRDYFLRESAALSTTPGSSRRSVDQDAGSPCSDFKPFGSWTTTFP